MLRALVLLIFAGLSATAAFAESARRIEAHVTITTEQNGVVAHFALEQPVTSFAFEYVQDDLQKPLWRVQTAGLSRAKGSIVAADGHPFAAFDVVVDPLNVPTAATYPFVFQVGSRGVGLYAAYFVGKADQFATTLTLAAKPDQVALGLPVGSNSWRVDRVLNQQAGHRYLFIGDKSYVQRDRLATDVISSETPASLVLRIKDRIDRSIAFYSEKTGRSLPNPPLVLLAMGEPQGPTRAPQGNVTRGPAVALRLFGLGLGSALAPEELTGLDQVLTHEAAHFWNSATFSSEHAEDEAWLHEGGADYWSFVARVKLLHVTNADRLAHISDVLNVCIGALGAAKFKSARSLATYSCGETLEWFADVGARKASSSRQDIFSVWQRMFARADANGGLYNGNDFRQAAIAWNPDLREAFALIFDQDGVERWRTLQQVLRAMDVVLEPAAAPAEGLRTTAVVHLERQACSHGPYGFWPGPNSLKLLTGDRCGSLSGDPEIDSIDGHNLFTDTRAAYDAVERACLTGGSVFFGRTGGDTKWSVTCKKPLPPLPPTFRIVSGG